MAKQTDPAAEGPTSVPRAAAVAAEEAAAASAPTHNQPTQIAYKLSFAKLHQH
jgi:hypothetical protein